MLNNSPILTIDLSAVANNWLLLASMAPCSKPAAVVKANAYGLGMTEVVKTLLDVGCGTFFVATLAEAIEFRDVFGLKPEVFVFSGCQPGEQSVFLKQNITPVLNSLSQLNRWQAFSKSAACAIMLDTGMNRLGLSSQELQQYLSNCKAPINVEYLLSHLACADDPYSSKNGQQLATYQMLLDEMKRAVPTVKGSLANSAGIFLGRNYHFDLIRPGIALYGGSPGPDFSIDGLQNVVKLSLPILQIRQLMADETVGYGADQLVPKGAYLATVQVGYADGIFRCAQGNLKGLIGSTEVPLVGRVSMDYCIFDVSKIILTGTSVAELENIGHIELLNDNQTIDDLARMQSTVSYEVIAALGSRYRKNYKR